MSKISSRQLYFFLAAIAPVGKLILMPIHLVNFAGNDLLFPAAVNFLLQTGAIALVFQLAKSGRPLGELLRTAFGSVGAKIVLTVFSAFLFFAATEPLLEQKMFVQSTFYDTLPSVFAFSSFFLFSAYVCSKPLSSVGRMWDILAPVAIAGFTGILLFAFGSADFGALLPVGASGAKGIFGGAAYTACWFYDAALLLPLVGKIEYKKGMEWKGPLCYLLGAAAVLLFLAVFYGVFSDIAIRQQYAFAKISKYFAGIGVLGRIDYVFIFALALVMAFYAALPLHAGVDCLRLAYGTETSKVLPAILSVAVNLVLLVLTLLFDYRFASVYNVIGKLLFPVFLVFCLLLPALSPLLKWKKVRHES